MSCISKIQDFAQECADNMSKILGLDVSIIDENNIRISGTGFHRELIGKPVPRGSFFEAILKTGQPGMIFDRHENSEKCRQCIFNERCTELATVGFPIIKRNKPIGVIGFIGFTSEQKTLIEENADSLSRFLQNFSALLENKLMLEDIAQEEDCQIHERNQTITKKYTFDDMIGNSEGLLSLKGKARKIVGSPSTVLIRGENGTGKELLAQAIHYHGARSSKPFISVNCSAIPESLIESELFGYEGGAFTGAKRQGKVGKFERANNGTIFLDEVGDLPLSMQPKLLRVLQERTVERVGGIQPIPVKIRVIAATNKNLQALMKAGTFREDLYYRLNVIPLNLPPLRERPDDIPLLLSYFIKKISRLLNREKPEVKPLLVKWLTQYRWPGNIRQLENVVEYMMNMNENGSLDFNDLPEELSRGEDRETGFIRGSSSTLAEMIADFERGMLLQSIPANASNIDKAKVAKRLDISLSTLYRKLEKYQLS